MSMTLSIYNFLSYLFNMDGIDYELEQNELLQEIEKDVLKEDLLKENEKEKEKETPLESHRKNLELELAFAFSPKPE